jgi:hypothetical protein
MHANGKTKRTSAWPTVMATFADASKGAVGELVVQ